MKFYFSTHATHIKSSPLILDVVSSYLLYFVKDTLRRGEV
jgi:hypothetical protein